ncbi:response regulator [Vreelandella massiliensis]|uniref:response regulator n=1 Tax=Vreelandella massiliensis TaxID=1816686 RepID=UPI00096AB201|nr:response regulator [Halomonas massiliensis]MYL25115.1 response regulator [Halomonas alkaliantarctica]
MTTILVIDDDSSVRSMLSRMLERQNYRVLTAESVDEGLEMLQQYRDIALVITDIVMPGRTGVEGVVAFHQRYPDLPVLAISGGSRTLSKEFSLDSAKLAGANALLPKPFTQENLLEAISRLVTES